MVKSNFEKSAVERSDSLFRGIRKRKWGKWVSEIRLPNSRQRIWLGSYDSAEKAARAFDAAMFCLRGSSAKFNFPDNPPNITGGRSMTHSQIRDAAARFANSEPHKEDPGRPDIVKVESFSSSSEETTLLPMQLPSPALSETTVQMESEIMENGLFTDIFSGNGLGYYVPDHFVFPDFDDFCGDFFVPEMPNFDLGDENNDELVIQDMFLWNF